MGKDKPHYISGVGWRYESKHSPLHRMHDHDYQSRCIYMVTLVTEDRRPILGSLHWDRGNPASAHVVPTPLGQSVKGCWDAIPDHYPWVRVLAFQLMPDHVHGLLFVLREQEHHLGQMVNGFKVGCNRAFRALVSHGSEALPQNEGPRPKHPEKGLVFAPGYHDSVLLGKGQLNHMFRYIENNPYRLAVKRENPDLFKVVTELKVGNFCFAAIGNRWLLDRPVRLQVRCHNSSTLENLALVSRQKEYLLQRGAKGGVLISPCISPGEREIAHAAMDAHIPLIVILENGFAPMYKPSGRYFEACAEGRLLMLAPWPYHPTRRKVTRSQCTAMNMMAQYLSSEPWTPEMELLLIGQQ